MLLLVSLNARAGSSLAHILWSRGQWDAPVTLWPTGSNAVMVPGSLEAPGSSDVSPPGEGAGL